MTGSEQLLARIADALGPYRSRVVVVGGFAFELFRYHPAVGEAARGVLTTLDVDLAAPEDMVPVGGATLGKQLFKAQFTEKLLGGTDPPLSALIPPPTWGTGYHVEVLVPAWAGQAKGVVKFHDLRAAQLRYLGIMLRDPWELDLGTITGEAGEVVVRVAQPGAYLAQKVLTVGDRSDPDKQKKDRAYCYALVARSKDRRALGVDAVERVRTFRFKGWVAKLRKRVGVEFESATSIGCRDASRYLSRPGAPGPPPAHVHATMADFVAGVMNS